MMATEKLVYSIKDVCETASIGRTFVYNAIQAGQLIAHKNGSRTVVFADDLKAWLASWPKVTPGETVGD